MEKAFMSKRDYLDVLKEHLAKHSALTPTTIAASSSSATSSSSNKKPLHDARLLPPIPDHISDEYTVEEKDEAYLRLGDISATKGEENLQDVSNEERETLWQRMEERLHTRQDGSASLGNRGGWEVVDSELDREEPDERVTYMDGSQELMDPLRDLPTDEFHSLSRKDDPLVFLREMDPTFQARMWIPESLTLKLCQLYQSTRVQQMDIWRADAMSGHVTRFADLCRQTDKRTELAFFVRRDLYLLLLLDNRDNGGFTLVAHFYAWSMGRVEQLLKAAARVPAAATTEAVPALHSPPPPLVHL